MIALTLMMLPMVFAEIPIDKKCADYPPIDPFDLQLEKLKATNWYEISSYRGGNCVEDAVAVTEDGKLNLVHYEMVDDDYVNTTITATVAENKLDITIGEKTTTATVLAIDYEKYAVLWVCSAVTTKSEPETSSQDLWILSTNIMNLSDLAEVNTLLATQGLSTEKLISVKQDEDTCCGSKIALSIIAITSLLLTRII